MKRFNILATITLIFASIFFFNIPLKEIAYGQDKTKDVKEKKPEQESTGKGALEKAGAKMTVKKGDTVKVQYKGSLSDGTVFDESKEGSPLGFVVGDGKIIPGLDKAIEGMKLDEEKRVNINAKDAYGARDETLVREFPLTSLPENFKPEKGMTISLRDQTGRSIPATISDVTKGNISIDLNHPLAGKDLIFDIKVVGIE